MSHAIHITNTLDEPIYVIVSPNKDYVFGEILSGVAMGVLITVATAGLGAGAGAATAATAVNNLSRLQRLVSLLQTIWRVSAPLREVASAGSQAYKWVKGANLTIQERERRNKAAAEIATVKTFFDENALQIAPKQSVRVLDTGLWNPLSYLGPTGWANVTGGSAISLFITDASFSRRAMFHTNTDYSWIVGRNLITRQQYGADLFKADPGAGWYRFGRSDRLVAGQALLPGESLCAPDGNYDFVFQEDCHAVVYRRDKPVRQEVEWASGSWSNTRRPGALAVQDDGNLVIYDDQAVPIMALHDPAIDLSRPGRTLVMQDDGNLCLYEPDGRAVWSSRHGGPLRRF